jgi:hypothetical protein
VRSIAASVVVALAVAALGFCGGGIALAATTATTTGGPGGAVLAGILPGAAAAATMQPDCTCGSAPAPTATCTGLPTVAPGPRVPRRPDPAPACSTAPVPFRPSVATKTSAILPVTGADIVPLAAVASLFLIVGAVACIAGRTGRQGQGAGREQVRS